MSSFAISSSNGNTDEHFSEKLEQQNPDGWKQAHARLYEYYKQVPEKELPDTLEEMEPLFAAVMHGCLAGKHQEAMDDIYSKKIRRRGEAYLEHKLGAFGVVLSCLSNFFEKPWSKPFYGLNDDVKAAVLSWAGFALRAVGELSRAIQPTKAALEMRIEQSNDLEVARIASNLSELYLTPGDVSSAQKYGEQCVIIADRNWEWIQKMINRTAFADALHQEGKIKVAEKLFIEAENIQKKNQPEYPWLCSLPGFRFCDLLLSMGKYQPVLEMVRCVIKIQTTTPVADFGLNNLSIGKALMMQVIDNNSSDFIETDDCLNQAINSFREAGYQDELPRALFVRATLSRHQHNFSKSWADLDEAREIAEYGQMRLHLTDYHLEACRVIRSQIDNPPEKQGRASKDYQIIEDGEILSLSKEEMQAKF